MKRINFLFVSCLLGLMIFIGCEKNKDEEPKLKSGVSYISYGTSFNYVVGYCCREVTVSDSEVSFIKSSWDENLKDSTCKTDMDEKDWEELIQQINLEEFNNLPEIVGCLDCVDGGGAEWVEINDKKVYFPYYEEPETIKGIITKLRSYLLGMEYCEANFLEMEIRLIAWNSLSQDAQATVVTDWREAPIELVDNDGGSVYWVTFNTTQDPLLGPIVVILDSESLEYLGILPRL